MPLHLLLEHDHAFGPDDIAVLTAALEECLSSLGLVNRADPATMVVAKAIIEAAKDGERDPKRLCETATKALSR